MNDTDYHDDLLKALEVLRSGGSILYPTDTIWGLGCDATNTKAVDNIYRIKQRIESKSLIILVSDFEHISNWVEEIPEVAADLIRLIENPLTIIYSNAKNLPENVIASDGTIGIRVVKEPFCIELIRLFGKPIISTSANISGEPAPVTFSHISNQILGSVDYIVKYKQQLLTQSKASTIIRLMETGEYVILRQ
ncbi:MAG TPA: L-threonylcarbamoyladenylate synthase [Bacteroidales bacterium]|nr:L-threonylcarbamoyladenylate synthase [Bacteroidales bacterium]